MTSSLLRSILIQRGIADPDVYLAAPRWQDIPHPHSIPNVQLLVDRILRARNQNECVAISADGNADGIIGSAILFKTLRALDISPLIHFPTHDNGYGLHRDAIHQFSTHGVRLLICVDNGITDHAELNLASRLGIDVLVIDHNSLSAEGLPTSSSVLTLWDSDYCSSSLGVMLSWALLQACKSSRLSTWVDRLNRLATVAAIAEGIPMTGTSRQLARLGLRSLGRTDHPGLQTLFKIARVRGVPTSLQLSSTVGASFQTSGMRARAQLAFDMLIEHNQHLCVQRSLALHDESVHARRGNQRSVEPTALLPECEVRLDELTPDFFDDLYKLEPFGVGNPPVVLSMQNLSVTEVTSHAVGLQSSSGASICATHAGLNVRNGQSLSGLFVFTAGAVAVAAA